MPLKAIVLIILLFFSCNLYALEGKEFFTWYGTTDESITVAWDVDLLSYQTGDIFELQIRNTERNTITSLGETTAFQKTFKCPKVGHWVVYGRTKRLINNVPTYSEWANSIDLTALVNGIKRPWWIYVYLKSPGPIIIK
jgi:hypothetical protein